MRDEACEDCLGVQGVCVDCNACFGQHCECDPCQHGKPRDVECVFCGRGCEALVDVMVQHEDDRLQSSLDWLRLDELP